MHLAAEAHVDHSIDEPGDFILTNINGTYTMLEAARAYWVAQGRPAAFQFHHISTDEVFRSLGDTGKFTEKTPYAAYAALIGDCDVVINAAVWIAVASAETEEPAARLIISDAPGWACHSCISRTITFLTGQANAVYWPQAVMS